MWWGRRPAPAIMLHTPTGPDESPAMLDKSDINRPLTALAGVLGAAGVALAARATHAAESELQIAANFLLLHAPVLLGISLLKANRLTQIAGFVLVAGLLLFCGDLAMRSEAGTPLFRLAAPVGGVGLIAGWLLLAVSAFMGWKR